MADDHYANSRYIDRRQEDDDVIELIKRFKNK